MQLFERFLFYFRTRIFTNKREYVMQYQTEVLNSGKQSGLYNYSTNDELVIFHRALILLKIVNHSFKYRFTCFVNLQVIKLWSMKWSFHQMVDWLRVQVLINLSNCGMERQESRYCDKLTHNKNFLAQLCYKNVPSRCKYKGLYTNS